MSGPLTEEEIRTLHIYNIFKMLEICRAYRLPHSVHSTSIIFYRKVSECRPIFTYTPKPILFAIILLACKSENLHGNVYVLLKNFNSEEKERTLIYESEVAAMLQFNFQIPSPYLKMLGILILLQERGRIDVKDGVINLENMEIARDAPQYEPEDRNIDRNVPYPVEDVNQLWNQSICNMDKVLICEEYFKMNTKECAFAALPLPLYLIDDLFKEVDVSNIKRIRESAKDVKYPDRELVSTILEKLGCIKR